ncbi:MAG TPA: hypothetical protein VFO36_00430, partial [Nitrospiraceae bacterium]|nr:hypothetical protein [Nitrospiraceae bacterium]
MRKSINVTSTDDEIVDWIQAELDRATAVGESIPSMMDWATSHGIMRGKLEYLASVMRERVKWMKEQRAEVRELMERRRHDRRVVRL